MEIKAELLYPYTEEQRIDFIVEQNHRNGYMIKEVKRVIKLDSLNINQDEEIQEVEEDTMEVIDLQALGYSEEERQAQKRERINNLTLTGADVERAIYEAKGMDFDDILEFVKNSGITSIDVKRLKIELKANNFYRGHAYINVIGQMLGYTPEDMDTLFLTKHLPIKEIGGNE